MTIMKNNIKYYKPHCYKLNRPLNVIINEE